MPINNEKDIMLLCVIRMYERVFGRESIESKEYKKAVSEFNKLYVEFERTESPLTLAKITSNIGLFTIKEEGKEKHKKTLEKNNV